jgi:aquaporin Z
MKENRHHNWKAYLIEAWALGMFMACACTVVILLEHPRFGLLNRISPFGRRLAIGVAMGATAILLIYSRWGKTSGAHMNPAVTLAYYQLDRISAADTVGYIVAQVIGASLFVLLFKLFFFPYISAPQVNYVVTMPGKPGIAAAFAAEFGLSALLFAAVLAVSNSRWAKYTGYVAGLLVCCFITVEAPLSGMSINPARTLGSAVAAHNYTACWLYLTAPVLGMQAAAFGYRRWYFARKGECKSMHCFMSGDKHHNKVYHVYKWFEKNE